MEGFECFHLDGERGLRLKGELDMQSAPRLLEACDQMQGDGRLRLDLTELTFIDSSGLHALLELGRAEDGNGPMVVTGVSAEIARLFEITQLINHPGFEIREVLDVE